MKTKVITGFDYLTEVAIEDESIGGTHFPFGDAVKFECDKHRENYTSDDARAVAEFVNQSSWLTRSR